METQHKIRPCLCFRTEAEEAARYYTGIFPNSKIDRISHYPGDGPGGKKGSVHVVEFTIAGQPHQAFNGGPHHVFNDAISLSVECEDQNEVDHYWNALTADGGKPVQCGWLKDKYGVSWQIVPKEVMAMLVDEDREKSRRVLEAVMQMVKLDIATLRDAYAGKNAA
jgi:predicted 3-demethylubiquinone-9 3-methyltransferase (glyoxalase superfamily)